jgi:hypothetical protein
VIYKAEGMSAYWNKQQMPISLEVTEDSLFVIETANDKIRLHGYLKDLKYILIHELYHSDSITISF